MLRQTSLALWGKHPNNLLCNVFRPRFLARKATPQSRIERINSRLPRFLHRYTTPLSTAPVSHITAFLLLHELTAILPLITLFATFHYTSIQLPTWLTSSAWVTEGVEKFGRYFRKKGWLGEDGDSGEGQEGWSVGADGMKILVEVGTAWAVVKMLLPVRLIVCVWATPWFARLAVLPVSKVIGRMTGRGSKTNASPAVGTNAVGASAVPKKLDITKP